MKNGVRKLMIIGIAAVCYSLLPAGQAVAAPLEIVCIDGSNVFDSGVFPFQTECYIGYVGGKFHAYDSHIFRNVAGDGLAVKGIGVGFFDDASQTGIFHAIVGLDNAIGAPFGTPAMVGGINLITPELVALGDSSFWGALNTTQVYTASNVLRSVTDITTAGDLAGFDLSMLDTSDPDTGFYVSSFVISQGGFLEPVPIPAAVWLFGSGLIGLLGLRRRKSR